MVNVGYATLGVIPSMKGLRSELDRQSRGHFEAVGRAGGKRLGDVAGKEAGKGFSARFSEATKGLAGPIAAGLGGAGLVTLFKGAVEGASNLQETTSKLRVIFGEASKGVESFAKDSTRNILLTEQAAMDAAATFGIFGKSAGLQGPALTNFATQLTGLASDLASFNNVTDEQAIQALGAALRGESEPIRAFGVMLDDATLRQEALKQGLISTTKEALTPQQKVLAAHAQILAQTRDAQGDAARTSDGYANSMRILKKELSEMQTELGVKVLPALTSLTNFTTDKALPALSGVGEVVGGMAQAFGALPGPVKAAAGAFAALAVAQRLGAGASITSGLGKVRSGMDTMRVRTMLARDEFTRLRTAQLNFVNGAPQFVGAQGRMASSMGALRTATAGAGTALRRGLGGAIGLLGGPWGLALAGGAVALTTYLGKQREAAAEVDALTGTLDKQTGAVTENTREWVFNRLEKEGANKAARELGIGLDVVREAAEGDAAALAEVKAVLSDVDGTWRGMSGGRSDPLGIGELFRSDEANAANTLRDALSEIGVQFDQARAKNDRWRESNGKTQTSNETVVKSTDEYRASIKAAREEIQKLLDKENERRGENLNAFNSETRLAQALVDARKEVKEGARTLDANSEAGRANRDALASLADTWNGLSDQIKNRKGEHESFRDQFIEIADQMGYTKDEAKKLAREVLELPKNTKLKVTPEMAAARAELRRLKREADEATRLRILRIQVQVSAASGVASANAIEQGLNNISQASPKPPTHNNIPQRLSGAPLMLIENQTVQAHNYDDFLIQQNQRLQRAALTGVE